MAKEILELEVKSNVKGAIKGVNDLTTSVDKAADAEMTLTERIKFQNEIIKEQEKALIDLKKEQRVNSDYQNSLVKMSDKIAEATDELKGEKEALKKLNQERRESSQAINSNTRDTKKSNIAMFRGIQHFQVMGVSMRKIKNIFLSIGPIQKKLFGSIKSGVIATGIGALLIAFGALFVWMKKSKVGAKALAGVFEFFGDVVASVTNLVVSVGDAVASLFGMRDTGAISAAEELAAAYEAVDLVMAKIEGRNIANQIQLSKNKEIIEDLTKTEKERINASNESSKLEQKNIADTIAANEKALKIAEKELKSQRSRAAAMKEMENAYKAMGVTVEFMMKKKGVDVKLWEKKVEEALQAIQVTENQSYDETKARDNEITSIKSTNIEKNATAQTNAIAASKTRRDKAANAEITIAKQLEKIRNELAYRELETVQEVEEAKLEIAKGIAEQLILDSAASQETKDAALLLLEEKYQSDLAAIIEKGAEKAAADKKASDKKKDAADEKIRVDDLKAEEAVVKAKEAIRDANLSNIDAGIALVKSLAGESKGVMAATIIAENAAGIAKILINTAAANAKAVAASPLTGGMPWVAVNSVSAGLGIAGSIAAASKGLSALGEGGSVSGGDMPDNPSDAPPAPEMMSGAFELSGGQAAEPARAYVVSDDITANQNKLAIIRRRATI